MIKRRKRCFANHCIVFLRYHNFCFFVSCNHENIYEDVVNTFASIGTVSMAMGTYLTLRTMKQQFKTNDKPIVVVENIKLCGTELVKENNISIPKAKKFQISFDLVNCGKDGAVACNVFTKAYISFGKGKENILVHDLSNNCYPVIGVSLRKTILENLKLDFAYSIYENIWEHINNKVGEYPKFVVETYYRNLCGQCFRNILKFNIDKFLYEDVQGNWNFNREYKSLENICNFQFFVHEIGSYNDGCKEISDEENKKCLKGIIND